MGERTMTTKLIEKRGKVEIWEVTVGGVTEWYVMGVTVSGDPRVCPSLGMAYEVAASA
jgi:hypothetical protein